MTDGKLPHPDHGGVELDRLLGLIETHGDEQSIVEQAEVVRSLYFARAAIAKAEV